MEKQYILVDLHKLEERKKELYNLKKRDINTSTFDDLSIRINEIEQLQQKGEVVQEVNVNEIRNSHFRDTNQHFDINKKWTQNWIQNNIKLFKAIEK